MKFLRTNQIPIVYIFLYACITVLLTFVFLFCDLKWKNTLVNKSFFLLMNTFNLVKYQTIARNTSHPHSRSWRCWGILRLQENPNTERRNPKMNVDCNNIVFMIHFIFSKQYNLKLLPSQWNLPELCSMQTCFIREIKLAICQKDYNNILKWHTCHKC